MTGQTDIIKIRMGPVGEKVEGGKEGETLRYTAKSVKEEVYCGSGEKQSDMTKGFAQITSHAFLWTNPPRRHCKLSKWVVSTQVGSN